MLSLLCRRLRALAKLRPHLPKEGGVKGQSNVPHLERTLGRCRKMLRNNFRSEGESEEGGCLESCWLLQQVGIALQTSCHEVF